MQRRTKTILAQLRKGDRFYKVGDKKIKIYEVREQHLYKTLCINPNLAAKFIDGSEEKFRNDKEIIFIRHTLPLPGDECFIEDLKEGDIFYKPGLAPGAISNEYKLIATGHDFYDVAPLTDTLLMEKAGRLATVIFVRHKEAINAVRVL